MEQQITLSYPQAQFVDSPAPYPLFVGGYGSGKTWAGSSKLCRTALMYPGVPLAYFGPTYSAVKDVFFSTIEECAAVWGMNTVIKRGDMEVHLYSGSKYRTTIICRSMRHPESIIGFKVGCSVTDELDTLKIDKAREAWLKIIARMRYKFDGNTYAAVTTTPEGFSFVYKQWVKDVRDDQANDNKNALADKYVMYRASTYDNSMYLQDGYIANLLSSYPTNLVRAYIYGSFVNLTEGSVYHDFDRVKNGSSETIKADDTLLIGADFNVENMSGVVCVKRGSDIHVVDEIIGALDTPALIRIIKERYWSEDDEGRTLKDHNIRVYPDSSGASRHTADASTSDIALLTAAGFNVVANKANPRVKDRVNAVNAAICNSTGERSFFVNVDRAMTVADNLEQQVYDNNGAPDKKSGKDHTNDSLGYVINMIKPLVKPATNINIRWAI
jgi:hypothetical protein